MSSSNARALDHRHYTAFIICEAGSDIASLVSILSQLNVETLNTRNVAVANNLMQATSTLIDQANVIIAILGSSTSNNVTFELGVAVGLQKRVVVIGREQRLFQDINDVFWIRASLTDETALSFQLGAYFANLNLKTTKRTYRQPKQGDEARSASKLVNGEAHGSALERDLLQTLQQSREVTSIVQEPQLIDNGVYIPDFAIWTERSPTLIESPIIFEVKGNFLSRMQYNSAANKLRDYAISAGVQTGLLLTDQGRKVGVEVIYLFPLIVSLSFDECKQLLLSGRLVDTLQHERNQYAHSAA